MSSKRRSRSTSSSSSSSESDSSHSSSSGGSSSSSSSDDEERRSKPLSAKKRPRSNSPGPAVKERNRVEASHRSSRQHSPDTGHARSRRPASEHHRKQRSPSPQRPSARSSRGYPYGDSKRDRQQTTDSIDRRDKDRQHERSQHDRHDDARDRSRSRHANGEGDRHREDRHQRDRVSAKPSRAHDSNERDKEGHTSKRRKSSGDMDRQQEQSAHTTRGNRDAQGLPGPPPDRGNQAGAAGRPPKGSGDRQNRWAQAGPLDNVPPGKEQWGKPGNGLIVFMQRREGMPEACLMCYQQVEPALVMTFLPCEQCAHVFIGPQQVRSAAEGDGRKGKEDKPEPEANFALSGKLAAESNTVKGVVLLHQEPPEARKPAQMWRLYGFKNGEPIDKPLYIHRQTCYLFGRERRVADVPLDHPSISKQHAVLQYRFTDIEGADGMMHSEVRPYLMDLGSANGTYLNNERIEPERYYELLEKDMVRFGHSTREYVLLHAQSND